jgi:hypothetical protein
VLLWISASSATFFLLCWKSPATNLSGYFSINSLAMRLIKVDLMLPKFHHSPNDEGYIFTSLELEFQFFHLFKQAMVHMILGI